MNTIELLTLDGDGNAIEGRRFPDDLGNAVIYAAEDEIASYGQRFAHRHKFFRRDEHGQPLPETLVAFLVPDYLLDDGLPSHRALRAVEQRMGWGLLAGPDR